MNLGGVAVVITNIINGTTNEFKHTLVTGICDKNEIDYLNNQKISAEKIYLNSLGRKIKFYNDFKSLFILTKLIRNLKPDIVHTHASKAGLIGRLATIFAGTKSIKVHTFHGHILTNYFGFINSCIFKTIERILAINTDRLIAVSHSVKNELQALKIGVGNSWSVIPIGINKLPKSNFEPKSCKDNFELFWIGRFEEIKNPMLAIKAFKLFSNLYPEHKIRFTMVGNGSQFLICKKFAKNCGLNINFAGWDANPFKSRFDLLLITSRNEGFGLVMLEAASRGIATLSTRIPAIEEFIENEVSGYLVDNTDIQIANKLDWILRNPLVHEKVANNARNIAESKFSNEKMIETYEILYNELLAQPH